MQQPKPPSSKAKPAAQSAKEKRLAEALKANLQRRKLAAPNKKDA